VRRLRVLVSAYACEPDRGSDPGVGWNQVTQLARFHDVWVITRENNREAIGRAAPALAGVHWVYHDLPRWARFWKRGQRGVHLYYYLWQLGCYRRARKLHDRIGFDVAHHVTFVNYWMPSPIALLPVRFLWGPVGGAESAPPHFWRTFSTRGKLFELARSVARWAGEHDPLVRLCARRSRLALATTPETATRLRRLGAPRVRLMGESGIGEDELHALAHTPRSRAAPLRMASVGRLVHVKGYHLSLEAFAALHARYPRTSYWLMGDGPERKRLEALASRLGVTGSVRFLGNLTRSEVLDTLSECDALVHPSLHDSGGWACLEAMAAGRPVICLDLGGPATQVSEESGIRIPALNPRQTVQGLAEAMLRMASDRGMVERLGREARSRVARCFTWEGKGDQMRRLYETLGREG
jgi:glycosyltransferase involved in cell wall biosynthesis